MANYDQALTIRPDHPEALNGRGIILQRQQRFEEALKNFDQALAIVPDYPSALNNRGNALLSLQLFDERLQAMTGRSRSNRGTSIIVSTGRCCCY